MPISLKMLIGGIMFFLLIGGSTTITLLSSSADCAITKNCQPFLKQFSSIVISPQSKISVAVDELSNVEKLKSIPTEIRIEYIASKQQVIVYSSFVSLLWIWLVYWFIMKLPAMADIGTKMIAFGFTLLLLSFVQSLFYMSVNDEFTIPYEGWIKLLLNKEVLSSSTKQAIAVGQDIVSPLT